MTIETRTGTKQRTTESTRKRRANRSRGSIHRLLADLHLSHRQTAKQLTVWPLRKQQRLAGRARVPVVSLAQALEDGFVAVDAVPRGCGVFDVHIFNRGSDAVLVVPAEEFPRDGGTLLADTSALVPPSQGLAVAAHRTLQPDGLDALRVRFRCVEGQVGFAAAIGDEVVGVELMSDPALFVRSFPSLLRPYLLDALSADVGGAVPSVLDPLFEAPECLLEDLSEAPVTGGPGLRGASGGWGRRLRIVGRRISGSALEAGEVVHLSAFPLEVAWAV